MLKLNRTKVQSLHGFNDLSVTVHQPKFMSSKIEQKTLSRKLPLIATVKRRDRQCQNGQEITSASLFVDNVGARRRKQ